MADRRTAEEKLAQLRELVVNARSMPMSASCVVNRTEVLAAIDQVIDNLPDEIADAQEVIDRSQSAIADGEAEAAEILARAQAEAELRAKESEAVKAAAEMAARVKAEAAEEAAALRRETDAFIDSRMASFESVLHKTSSQVRTARARLAERSGLNADPAARTASPPEPRP
ncbi:MAG: hypothetical protein JWP61_1990 [Friedmanniella sp.]|nr:hypothetical protein [Friedmanniella sp.]